MYNISWTFDEHWTDRCSIILNHSEKSIENFKSKHLKENICESGEIVFKFLHITTPEKPRLKRQVLNSPKQKKKKMFSKHSFYPKACTRKNQKSHRRKTDTVFVRILKRIKGRFAFKLAAGSTAALRLSRRLTPPRVLVTSWKKGVRKRWWGHTHKNNAIGSSRHRKLEILLSRCDCARTDALPSTDRLTFG